MYQPPPQKSVGARPRSRSHAPSRRTRSPVAPPRGPRVGRAREVRVVAERPARRRLARAGEPELLVGLARLRVRAAGAAPRSRDPPGRRSWSAANAAQTRSSSGRSTWHETTAYRSGVVGGIAQRIPRGAAPPGGGRAPRSRACSRSRSSASRSSRPTSRRATSSRGRSSRAARSASCPGSRRRTRSRSTPGSSPALYWPLDRSWAVVGLAQVVVAVGDGAARARDRHAPRVGADRRDRGARRDAAPVPRLARHPRQPRDPRRAARRGDRPARAARVRAPLAAAGARARRGDRARDPLQRPPAAPAARPRAVRRVARPAGRPRDRRGARSSSSAPRW